MPLNPKREFTNHPSWRNKKSVDFTHNPDRRHTRGRRAKSETQLLSNDRVDLENQRRRALKEKDLVKDLRTRSKEFAQNGLRTRKKLSEEQKLRLARRARMITKEEPIEPGSSIMKKVRVSLPKSQQRYLNEFAGKTSRRPKRKDVQKQVHTRGNVYMRFSRGRSIQSSLIHEFVMNGWPEATTAREKRAKKDLESIVHDHRRALIVDNMTPGKKEIQDELIRAGIEPNPGPDDCITLEEPEPAPAPVCKQGVKSLFRPDIFYSKSQKQYTRRLYCKACNKEHVSIEVSKRKFPAEKYKELYLPHFLKTDDAFSVQKLDDEIQVPVKHDEPPVKIEPKPVSVKYNINKKIESKSPIPEPAPEPPKVLPALDGERLTRLTALQIAQTEGSFDPNMVTLDTYRVPTIGDNRIAHDRNIRQINQDIIIQELKYRQIRHDLPAPVKKILIIFYAIVGYMQGNLGIIAAASLSLYTLWTIAAFIAAWTYIFWAPMFIIIALPIAALVQLTSSFSIKYLTQRFLVDPVWGRFTNFLEDQHILQPATLYYCPHLATSIMQSFSNDCSESEMSTRLTQYMLREASLPIQDDLALNVQRGTVLCCKYILRNSAFFHHDPAVKAGWVLVP